MSLSYYADIDPVMTQDCILHAAPLSHGAGLYGLLHVARGAVKDRYDPRNVFCINNNIRPTGWTG